MNPALPLPATSPERLREPFAQAHAAPRGGVDVFESMIGGVARAEIIRDGQDQPCDFRLLEVDEAFARLIGVTRAEAAGKTARALLPGLEQHWIETFSRVVALGEPVRVENYVRALDKWFEVFAHPTLPGQFAFLFIDITERKRAETTTLAEFKLAEAVFTHSISPLVVLDRDYNFMRVNEAYARSCGRQVSEFTGRNHFEMYPSDVKLIFDDVVQAKRPFTTFMQAFVFPDQPERGITYWDWTLVPVLDSAGEVENLVFSLLDVTERQVAADQLQHSEARYRQQAAELEMIYRTAPIGLCVMDTQLRYIHINAHLAELNGAPVEAHIGKTVRDILPNVADQVEPLLSRVLETGEPILDFEASTEVRGGGRRHWSSQYWPLRASDGRVFGINAVTQEITERRRLEETRRREKEFRSLAENSTDIISRFDRDLRRTYVNRAIEAFLDQPREELIGKTHREIGLPEKLADQLDSGLKTVFATGEAQRVEAVIPTAKGERYLDAQLVPEFDSNGSVKTVLTISRDLTERKQTEDALQASERKYRTLVDNLYEGIWLLDQDANTTFVNARMAELLGYQPQEMLGKPLFAFIDPRLIEGAHVNLEWGKSGARATYDFEFRRKDGRTIWARVAATPLFGDTGDYQGALAGVIDITERKRAEEALHRREQEFAALAERSPDIIARIDRSLRIRYINLAAERITGRPPAWFIGKTPAECELSEHEVAMREQALTQVFESGQELIVEHQNPTLIGDRYFQTRIVPELGPDDTVQSVLVVERDIEDLKRAQQALEELTLLDPLTGVANRRFLERFGEQEWLREARQRLPVAAIMIDIDHFKAYNDRYGHAQGDACLREVCTALRDALLRPSDTLVRYGGEEFVVLLPESDVTTAREIAERLRQAVEARHLSHQSSPLADHVTISLGVAALSAEEGAFHDLLAAADAALYRAKAQGRNRVELNT